MASVGPAVRLQGNKWPNSNKLSLQAVPEGMICLKMMGNMGMWYPYMTYDTKEVGPI